MNLRKNIIRFILIALTAVGAVPSAASAAELPPTEFTFVGTWANLSLFKKVERPFWEDEIPQKSNGAIKVKVQPFTEMGLKGGEVFRLLRSGVINVGSTVLAYIGGEIPEADAADIAGITRNIDDAHKISDAYKPVLAAAFEKEYGVKLLAIVPYHAQIVYCRQPISNIKDFRGLKVRASGKTQGDMIAALGGAPVGLAFGEVVPALQKGVVDCAITGALSGNLAKWHQATTHLYPLPINWATTFVAANLKFWNSLDPKVQAFLEKELDAWEDRAWESGRSETKDGISCNTGGPCKDGNKASMTLVPVNEGDYDELRRILTDVVLPKWAERCGAECTALWNESAGKAIGFKAPVN